jgi:hypothetical protein
MVNDTRNPCRGDPRSARSASAGIRMGATDVLSRGCGGQIIARGGNPGNTSIPTFLSSGGAAEYHESVPLYYICTLEIIVKFANNL